MNKIRKAFADGKAFMPFVTGGDPDIETTEKLLYALSEAGADLIEIGIPFSDPIAEGPVIEAADERALKAGCTVDKLFDLLARVRSDMKAPLLFVTYYNPVFAYGIEKFTERCNLCGIDGLIVPDLPFEERDELLAPCQANGLTLISLIAPTSEDRITRIAQNAEGFLYCVSSMDGTGERRELNDGARAMIEKAKAATATGVTTASGEAGDIPCAVGFDVSGPEQAREIARYADGVMVGSAIVSIVAEHGRDCVELVFQFAKRIKQALTKNE